MATLDGHDAPASDAPASVRPPTEDAPPAASGSAAESRPALEEDDEDDAPPGFSKPAAPDARTADSVADLASGLQRGVQLDGEPGAAADSSNAPDEPDLSLSLVSGLREPEAEIAVTNTEERSIYVSAHKFEDLPLSPELLKGLYVEMKFERPSKIQAETLPMILTPPYRDLIAQAHNGSGKTTCFVLSMLSRVDPKLREPQALCICPTRELVVQNLSVLLKMGKYTGISAFSTASDSDSRAQRRDPIHDQIVVGTHGRLKNWATKRILSLDFIQILVFDEADEMLKGDAAGDDSVRLIKNIRKKNPKVQLLLFSATFNDKVKEFAMQIAPRANNAFVAKEQLSLDVIAQFNVICPDRSSKTRVLKEMIFPNCETLGQTMIFVRTRESARQLHSEMEKEGYKCTSIQGDMLHEDRDRVVQEFRDGVTKVLISTDVLSRGFDVSQVTLVINYDVPVERDQRTPNFETYLHRIGRSGRFGRKGVAFNLICGGEDARVMTAISNYFNKNIASIEWDDEDKFLEALKNHV